MRLVTKTEMLDLYEKDLLRDIVVLDDCIIARKVGHSSLLDESPIEVVRCLKA